jgi:hypothetical protein
LLGISWHVAAALQLVCFVAVFLRNASLAVSLGAARGAVMSWDQLGLLALLGQWCGLTLMIVLRRNAWYLLRADMCMLFCWSAATFSHMCSLLVSVTKEITDVWVQSPA